MQTLENLDALLNLAVILAPIFIMGIAIMIAGE